MRMPAVIGGKPPPVTVTCHSPLTKSIIHDLSTLPPTTSPPLDAEAYALADAAAPGSLLLPIYVFDPTERDPQPSLASDHSVAFVGPFATRFLLEALADLR